MKITKIQLDGIVDEIEVGTMPQLIVDKQKTYKEENGVYGLVSKVTSGNYTVRVDSLVHPDGESCYHLYASKTEGKKTLEKMITCTTSGEWAELLEDPLMK